MDPKQYFRQNLKEYSAEITKYKKKASQISWLRLITFLLTFAGIYIATRFNFFVLIFVIILFMVIFFRVVYLHNKTIRKLNISRRLREINKNELKALNHDFSHFVGGSEYQNPAHSFTSDLNIFGDHSVFRIVNRCITEEGEKILANFFTKPPLSADRIKAHQNAVRELSGIPGFIQQFLEAGQRKQLSNSDYQKLSSWADLPVKKVMSRKLLAYGFSTLTLAVLALTISGIPHWSLLIFWIITGLIITGFFSAEAKTQHQYLTNINSAVDTSALLIRVINSQKFKSPLLEHHQKEILPITGKGPLHKLARILQSFDMRLNIFAAFLLNSLFLWDIHQLARLYQWKNKNAIHFRSWLEALFYFDAFISLGNFAFSYPEYNYPMPAENNESFFIYGINFKHILIPQKKRIGNPVDIKDRGNLSIITGANMAGKSTYLRTIGLNMVLGRIGLPVDCTDFQFTPVELITNLSMKDSLVKNESFFYAELKRLQLIINNLEKGKKLFFLLDEILKGTNSKDKQTGSLKLLRKLIRLNTNGIVATHDLHLGQLENEFPDKIQNHCFEVEIQNDKLFFDYKLKDGIAKSLNASFLMRKMGITK